MPPFGNTAAPTLPWSSHQYRPILSGDLQHDGNGGLIPRLFPRPSGGCSPGGPGCHWGGKSPNNGLICLLVPMSLYIMLAFGNIFWTTVTGSIATKTVLANKDNSCSGIYVHLTVRIRLTIQ